MLRPPSLGGDMGPDMQTLTAGATATVPSSPCLPAEGCFPSWCSWMSFGDYFDACRVPTQAEMDAAAKVAITKAATATTGPDVGQVNQSLVDQQYAAYQGDVAALCKLEPESCQAFQNAGNNPTCSKLFGPSSPLCGPNGSKYLWIGGAVIGGLFLYSMSRR
jgi:hypothetical protein